MNLRFKAIKRSVLNSRSVQEPCWEGELINKLSKHGQHESYWYIIGSVRLRKLSYAWQSAMSYALTFSGEGKSKFLFKFGIKRNCLKFKKLTQQNYSAKCWKTHYSDKNDWRLHCIEVQGSLVSCKSIHRRRRLNELNLKNNVHTKTTRNGNIMLQNVLHFQQNIL